jgi:rSAM/selenodomain-associated transferase 2
MTLPHSETGQENPGPAERMISIIIPTLNEERAIGMLLETLAALRPPVEVIVADGGSTDRTVGIVSERGARVIAAERGRGSQMRAGAARAQGDVLWFLHADTLPPPDAVEEIEEALRDNETVAGNFAVRFDGDSPAARFLTWHYPLGRKLGLCYGESAIFVRRSAYDRAGGIPEIPLFEDIELVRRVRRLGGFAHLPGVVVASSRRFEGRSFALTYTAWVCLQLLFWMGVSPRLLAHFYAPIRKAGRRARRSPSA